MAKKVLAQVKALLVRKQQKEERIEAIEAEIADKQKTIVQIQENFSSECKHVYYQIYKQSEWLKSRHEYVCIVCGARFYGNLQNRAGVFDPIREDLPSVTSDRKEEVNAKKQEIHELEKLISTLEREKRRCISSIDKIEEELLEIAGTINNNFNFRVYPSDAIYFHACDDIYYKD